MIKVNNSLINIEQVKVEADNAFWFGLVLGSAITLFLVSSKQEK